MMLDKLGDLSGLMHEAQRIQQEMKRVQGELAEKTVEASAGGGLVTARVNGLQELVAVKIDPAAVKTDEIDLLEDLIVAAVAQAMRKSQEMAKAAFGGLTAGFKIPGLMP
jgi:DNA-binding YbaB/EbfC family protein